MTLSFLMGPLPTEFPSLQELRAADSFKTLRAMWTNPGSVILRYAVESLQAREPFEEFVALAWEILTPEGPDASEVIRLLDDPLFRNVLVGRVREFAEYRPALRPINKPPWEFYLMPPPPAAQLALSIEKAASDHPFQRNRDTQQVGERVAHLVKIMRSPPPGDHCLFMIRADFAAAGTPLLIAAWIDEPAAQRVHQSGDAKELIALGKQKARELATQIHEAPPRHECVVQIFWHKIPQSRQVSVDDYGEELACQLLLEPLGLWPSAKGGELDTVRPTTSDEQGRLLARLDHFMSAPRPTRESEAFEFMMAEHRTEDEAENAARDATSELETEFGRALKKLLNRGTLKGESLTIAECHVLE